MVRSVSQPKAGLQEPGWKGGHLCHQTLLDSGLIPPCHLQAGASRMSGFASLSFSSCVKKQDFIVLPTRLQGGLTERIGALPTSEEIEMQRIL